jgi:hypothetical protein
MPYCNMDEKSRAGCSTVEESCRLLHCSFSITAFRNHLDAGHLVLNAVR